MKYRNNWMVKLLLLAMLAVATIAPGILLGAEDAAAAVTAAAEQAAALPWQLGLIPVLTPLIIAGVKLLVPKIPGAWLPVLAPVLGLVLDLISHFTTGSNLNVWLAAGLGLAGVGVREAVDQVSKAGAPKPAGGSA